MQDTILDIVGNTPFVKLSALNPYACDIWLKLESKNPAGSVKDRVAAYSIQKNYAENNLSEQSVIIEASSGNTGIALAMIAAVYKARCIITMPDNMTVERIKAMQAYGAEVVLTPAAEGMAGSVKKAEELYKNTPNSFMLNQFANPHMVDAHYASTGPEIFSKFGSDMHALVAGVGTGGTISGTGLYLRERLPHLKILAVEPHESPMLSEGKAGKHGIQGIGPNFISKVLRQDILDEIMQVKTDDAIAMSKELFTQEGISCGISSGANVAAALQLAQRDEMQGKTIVTFICDTGERYLSSN